MRHLMIVAILATRLFFGNVVSAQEPQAPASNDGVISASKDSPAGRVNITPEKEGGEKKAGKKETPLETITRLSVSPEGETPGEKRVRLKALELLLQEQAKKASSERMKTLTPAELKAEREISKEDKREAKAIEARRKGKIDTGLYCKTQEDYDRVWVSGVSSQRWQASTHTSMTIVNNTDAWLQIRRVSGIGGPVVVDMFCPRGTITLQERLPPLTGAMEVAYTAVSATVGAGPATVNQSSPRLTMFKCQSIGCQWEFSAQWQIEER